MMLPSKVISEDIFADEITSSVWASYGQCAEYEKRYFMFAGGFRGDGNLCASTDSSRDGDRFHLFLECSVAGKLATYMGTAYYSETFIEIKLTEYRGATGADDVYIELERCEK
jgi:hypothetical protein